MPLHKVPTKPITALHSTLNSVALMTAVSSGLVQLPFLLNLSLHSLFEVNYCGILVIKLFEIYLQWPCNSSNSLHQLQGKRSLSRQKTAWKRSILRVVKKLTIISFSQLFLNTNGVSTHNCEFVSLTRSSKLHKWDASLQGVRNLRCNLRSVKINDKDFLVSTAMLEIL